MNDSDVFIISAVRSADPAQAIHQALQGLELNPGRVQDVIFGLDGSPAPRVDEIVRKAGLTCPSAAVSSSLRAVFFAAQSILSGDVELAVVVGMHAEASVAISLASPDAVGRWNLLPRARLAARSLAGAESALRAAGLATQDPAISLNGQAGALLVEELLGKLDEQKAQWGLVSVGKMALVVERV